MGTICPQALAHCYGRRCLQIGEGKLGSEAADASPTNGCCCRNGSPFLAMETTFTQSEKEENVISLTLGFFDKDIFDVLHFKQVFFNSHKQFIFNVCIYYCHKFHLFADMKTNFPHKVFC